MRFYGLGQDVFCSFLSVEMIAYSNKTFTRDVADINKIKEYSFHWVPIAEPFKDNGDFHF